MFIPRRAARLPTVLNVENVKKPARSIYIFEIYWQMLQKSLKRSNPFSASQPGSLSPAMEKGMRNDRICKIVTLDTHSDSFERIIFNVFKDSDREIYCNIIG